MPLSTAEQKQLLDQIRAWRYGMRPFWDDAGTWKHIRELAQDPRPASELVTQAHMQATNPANRAPACLVWPLRTADTGRRERRPVSAVPDVRVGAGDYRRGAELCRQALERRGRLE